VHLPSFYRDQESIALLFGANRDDV
jgi:hypothetical protein